MKNIIEILTNLNKTIATMESCTGGGVVNAITNVEGASEVLKFSAVTYSNEYKIKMGVNKDVIDQYSVYSMEVANDMSKSISKFAKADYGIGITGKLKQPDKYNPASSTDNIVFVSIYDAKKNNFYNLTIEVGKTSRQKNKTLVIERIVVELKKVLS